MKMFEEPIIEVAKFSVEDVVAESMPQLQFVPPCMK